MRRGGRSGSTIRLGAAILILLIEASGAPQSGLPRHRSQSPGDWVSKNPPGLAAHQSTMIRIPLAADLKPEPQHWLRPDLTPDELYACRQIQSIRDRIQAVNNVILDGPTRYLIQSMIMTEGGSTPLRLRMPPNCPTTAQRLCRRPSNQYQDPQWQSHQEGHELERESEPT
jgi:hypothetical protein